MNLQDILKGVKVVKVLKDNFMDLYTPEAYKMVKESIGEHVAQEAYVQDFHGVITTLDLE